MVTVNGYTKLYDTLPVGKTIADLFPQKRGSNITIMLFKKISSLKTIQVFLSENKKVLLRERKRHTTHRVASTPHVVLTGYPPILTWLGGRVPGGGTWPGYPPSRVPPQAGYPPGWTWEGNPPPRWLPHGILGNVAKHNGIWVPPPPVAAPWHSGKCCKALWDMGTPPPRCGRGQTNKVKLLPSRRTTYAGGKNEL